jgi:3-methyladenine DNA glycosylase/8-oxoguanine DNA glycosylase
LIEDIFSNLRISSMVENLCVHYGSKVLDFEEKSYFAFPNLEALAQDDVEAKLRTLGFGYRSAYISKTAKQVNSLKLKLYLRPSNFKFYLLYCTNRTQD